jgi:hypothetical protein
MAIELSDDGTLDTVLRCSICGEEFRGNYDPPDDLDERAAAYHDANPHKSLRQCAERVAEIMYEEFVSDFIIEIESEHECEHIDCYDGESGALLLTASAEALNDCSTPGQPANDSVDHWRDLVTWRADDATLRQSLRGYGAWDDLQTADMESIKDRVLWIAACDYRDNKDHE